MEHSKCEHGYNSPANFCPTCAPVIKTKMTSAALAMSHRSDCPVADGSGTICTCETRKRLDDINALLAERGARYGVFANHAELTQDLKAVMFNFAKGDRQPFLELAPDQREALEMIAHKIGRILNGDPNYADNWCDIAGYAQLIADRLEGK